MTRPAGIKWQIDMQNMHKFAYTIDYVHANLKPPIKQYSRQISF